MITLEKEFVANYDKMGDNKFIQVKRDNKAAIYKRQRMDGKLVGFEIFKIMIQPKGTKFPGGVVTTEDKERYPSKNSFGKWAWFTTTLDRANIWFDRVSNDPEIIGDYDPETNEPIRPENDPSLEEVMAQPDKEPVKVIKPVSNPTVVAEQPVETSPEVPTPTVQPKKRGRPAKNTKPIEYKYPEGEFDRTTFAKLNGLPFDPVEPSSYIGIKLLIEKGLIIKTREQYTGSRPKSIYAAVKQT